MLLKEIYHKEFMRRKIDKEYLQTYENVTVLGERFLGNDYVVVFQVEKPSGLHHYLLVENISKPILVELEQIFHEDNYIVFYKKSLFDANLPKKILKNLGKQGLHMKTDNIRAGGNSKRFDIHRLVACLYQNILGHEIHHIDKDNQQNNVCNLVKLWLKRHRWVDRLPVPDGIRISLRMQARQKRKIFKLPKQTLPRNTELILEILRGNNVKRKICKNKIYEIKKDFFYASEFLEWHEKHITSGVPDLNVKFEKRWKFILDFENLEIAETIETIEKPYRRIIKNVEDDFLRGETYIDF